MSCGDAADLLKIGFHLAHSFGHEAFVVIDVQTKKHYALKRRIVASEAAAREEFEALQRLNGVKGVVKTHTYRTYPVPKDKAAQFLQKVPKQACHSDPCSNAPPNTVVPIPPFLPSGKAEARGGSAPACRVRRDATPVYFCAIMQLCENGSLGTYISNLSDRKGFLFSEPNVTRVIRQLTDVLCELKRCGVVHGMLNPNKVHFMSAAQLVLGGFNHLLQPLSQLHCPAPHTWPEDHTGGEVTEKVDTWGLGLVILEMCCVDHHLPHHEKPCISERIVANQKAEHSRLRTLFRRRGYSCDIAYLTCKLLEGDPNDRYSAEDVLNLLDGKTGSFPDLSQFGYHCHRLIGKGGSAKVFCVDEVRTKRQFALKQTHILNSNQEKDVETETDMLKRAKHDRVVEYHDSFYRESGRGERFYCIVMELCENSLDGLLGEREQLLEREILLHLMQLAQAMQHLHGLRIFHRDIAPKNVLITRDNQLKLGDFGISNTFGDLSNPRTSRIGTPRYVSPEVYAGALQSEKVDMWGLGVLTLDQCGVLRLNEALHDLIRHREQQEHDRIAAAMHERGFSDFLTGICIALIRFDPESRPSADDVLDMLAAHYAEHPDMNPEGTSAAPSDGQVETQGPPVGTVGSASPSVGV
eukprot:TRINITY_DN23809_c0_g1_i1.p1 TRINITY_DN23809_c0_g1~~TRINITY_DN23809_c0_g1_i1.p1  ORF type:complete len:638 (+),score=246.43 TRINITY_DN23809_c0_g1_i1:166-2079(+)